VAPHHGDRAAQRPSIRRALKTIRLARACDGGNVHIGHGGASVVYSTPGSGSCQLSGHSLAHCHTALAAMAAGVPWVDTRPVTDIGALIGAPIIACGMKADPPPWHGLSHAPLAKVFAYHRKFGAVTGNETELLAEHDETDYLGGGKNAA
jgi:uncharacterized protein YbjT (DUF2867 family)